jgi:hypothetical protein
VEGICFKEALHIFRKFDINFKQIKNKSLTWFPNDWTVFFCIFKSTEKYLLWKVDYKEMLLRFGYFFSLSKLLIFLSSEHIKKQKSKTHFEVSVTVADECACISTAANVSQMISELNKLKQKYKTRRERKRPIFQIPLFQNVFFNIQFFLSKLLFLSFQLCTFFESFKTNF